MDSILALLPQHEGILPKWLLFVSLVAAGNSIQATLTRHFNVQIYNVKPNEVTGLSSRTFAIWTLLAAVVRLYGAYYISNPQIYDLTFWSYVFAFLHFVSEWFVFGTAKFGRGLAGPCFVSIGSMIWMLSQRDFYVKA